ncbi:hypothetical protein, partial [Desulfovibrio sp. DV]|uniref:hypothetical protein n=1 Tax=Desulfovibrio sp. DV TaxID=1844708 RepID=UPI00094BB994
MTVVPRRIAVPIGLALLAALLVLAPGRPARAEQPVQPALDVTIDEATLVVMLDDLIKYYVEARPAESQIIALLPTYEKSKDSAEYKKLRFLFDTYQKATTSLNNLVDVLYIYLKLGNSREKDVNEYVVNRSKNIITFLNSMVYLLTTRNQELDISGSSDVQKLYETYLVRL